MHWNCAILENAQKKFKKYLKVAHFPILRNFSAFLVVDYEEVVYRSSMYATRYTPCRRRKK